MNLNPEITSKDVEIAARLFGADLVDLDADTRKYTAFTSFIRLCVDPGGAPHYKPSLNLNGAPGKALARAYNRFQAERGDARRVGV